MLSFTGIVCRRCGRQTRFERPVRASAVRLVTDCLICRGPMAAWLDAEGHCLHPRTQLTERDSIYCLDCRSDVAVIDG